MIKHYTCLAYNAEAKHILFENFDYKNFKTWLDNFNTKEISGYKKLRIVERIDFDINEESAEAFIWPNGKQSTTEFRVRNTRNQSKKIKNVLFPKKIDFMKILFQEYNEKVG